MKNTGNIFLIGPMGAGKSTIGRQVAKKFKWKFFDSDHEIEQRTGVDIPLIFDIEGEHGFRRRESQIIDELTAHSGIILATGGGAVLDPDNRKHIAERGYVVYLKAGLDQLLKRTAKDQKRPLLQNNDPRSKIQELLAEREPLYLQVADLVMDTDNLSVKNIIDEICNQQKFI